MPWNIPILLTWLRILLIPIFTALFYLPQTYISQTHVNIAAALIFALAGITDWLDGFLARHWKQTSDFGAFLDPVADKLMVAVSLILLVKLDRTLAIYAMIIIGREITISALREWMAQMGKRNSVAVAYIGKLKTAAQMAAIFALLLNFSDFYGINFNQAGNLLMFIASVLTIWSMFYYLNLAWKEFQYIWHKLLDNISASIIMPTSFAGFAKHAGIAQLVERNLAKVEVASSRLVSRSIFLCGEIA